MKESLPNPYTTNSNASNKVDEIFKVIKKKVGIKTLKNRISREIVKELGNSIGIRLLNNYIKIIGYVEYPELIYHQHKLGKTFFDGDYCNCQASTI